MLAAASLVFCAASAHAATITFNAAGDCISAAVSITKGAAHEACQVGGSPNGTSALVGTGATDSFWTAVFTAIQSDVSIDLGDFNQDEDRLYLTAFDAGANALGTVTFDIAAAFSGMHTLSFSAPGIKSIEFGTLGNTEGGLGFGGIYADNLTWTASAVPAPATLPLLLTGLGALGLARRRKKQ